MTEAYRIEEFFYGKFNWTIEKMNFYINFTCVWNIALITAATLETKGASTTWKQWEPEQRLQLRQVVLGHTAKPNEFNIIEVMITFSFKEIKKNEWNEWNAYIYVPIALLK